MEFQLNFLSAKWLSAKRNNFFYLLHKIWTLLVKQKHYIQNIKNCTKCKNIFGVKSSRFWKTKSSFFNSYFIHVTTLSICYFYRFLINNLITQNPSDKKDLRMISLGIRNKMKIMIFIKKMENMYKEEIMISFTVDTQKDY